jgi:hypothetical protein
MRLFINDIEAELPTGVQIALTKQVATLFGIEARQTDYTNRIVLPATPKNINLMLQLGINGNESDRPYKYATARIENNTVCYADNLVAITDSTSGGYEIRLLGNPVDFSSQMKNKQLRDVIDLFTSPVINYTATAFRDLQSAAGGYTFPLIAQLRPFANKDVRFLWADLAYPGIFTKDIIDKMLSQYFPSYQSNALTGQTFAQEVSIPMATENLAWQDYERIALSAETISYTLSPPVFSTLMFLWYFDLDRDLKDQLVDAIQTGDPDQYIKDSTGVTLYRVPGARRLQMTYKVRFNFQDTGGTTKFKLQLRRKPSTQADVLLTDAIVAETDFYEPEGTYDVEGSVVVDTKNGEDYYWCGYCELANTILLFDIIEFTLTIQPIKQGIFQDSSFNPKWLIPDMTEWDYFEDLCKRFGLVFAVQQDGSLRLESFKDIFDGAFGVEDWTKKFVRQVSESYAFGSYGKSNIFKFDGDTPPKDSEAYTGWEDVIFDNDNYSAKEDMVVSKGVAAQVRNRMQGAEPNVIDVGGFEVVDTDKVYLTPSDKIAYCNLLQNDDFTFYFLLNLKFGTTFSAYTGTGLDPSVNLQALPLQIQWADRIDEFYGDLLPSIERPTIKTIQVLLTEADFYSLDFFKPKYFEQYQAYFYLVKAENYIPGRTTSCQFLQIKTS